jgi:hypothetical protein
LLLTAARNRHVKDGLQKAYASKFPGKTLEVFCVSNTWYETFSEEGDTDMVRASGIPELRRFCHTITADAQLLEAKHFIRSKLACLLNSAEIWALRQSHSAESPDGTRYDSIYETLQTAKLQVCRT